MRMPWKLEQPSLAPAGRIIPTRSTMSCFPGLFKGLSGAGIEDLRGHEIRRRQGLASIITDGELSSRYIIPDPFDPRVAQAVSEAVADQAVAEGLNGIPRA